MNNCCVKYFETTILTTKNLRGVKGIYLELQWTLVIANSQETNKFCSIKRGFIKPELSNMGWKMKKSYFLYILKKLPIFTSL